MLCNLAEELSPTSETIQSKSSIRELFTAGINRRVRCRSLRSGEGAKRVFVYVPVNG